MIYLITYLVGFMFTFAAAYLVADNEGEEVKEPYKTSVCLLMAAGWPILWLLMIFLLLFRRYDG